MGGKTSQTQTNVEGGILGGGLGVLTAMQIGNIGRGEAAQKAEINRQLEAEKAQANEQSIQRSKQLDTMIGSSIVQASARGISTASGSFKAANEQSFQTAINADRVSDFNILLKKEAARNQINAIHAQAQADKFNTVLDFGKDIFTIGSFFL